MESDTPTASHKYSAFTYALIQTVDWRASRDETFSSLCVLCWWRLKCVWLQETRPMSSSSAPPSRQIFGLSDPWCPSAVLQTVVWSGLAAPPQTAYVNSIIMLFRSIDRPACRRCQSEVRSRGGDVFGAIPSDWEATSHRGGWVGAGVLTPAAPRWASELWPFPFSSLSDGGRLTASPKSPGCLQTSAPSSPAVVGAQISLGLILRTDITTRWSVKREEQDDLSDLSPDTSTNRMTSYNAAVVLTFTQLYLTNIQRRCRHSPEGPLVC